MPDCDRCGTYTQRDAFGSELPVTASDIVYDNNGVLWLCDACVASFGEWLDSVRDEHAHGLGSIRQAAIKRSKPHDKWAVICTDGDYEYARTEDEALTIFSDTVKRTEYLSGDFRHDYALVRVDMEDTDE